MKAGRIFVALLTVFAVGFTSGCGKSSEQKEAESLAQEGNDKIAKSYANEADLLVSYGIDLDPSSNASATAESVAKSFDWSQFNPAQRADIKVKLFNQMSMVNRVFEIGHHKNLRMNGAGSDLQTSSANARCYYDSLNVYRASINEK